MTEHAHDLWDRCRGELEQQVSGGVFLMYFEPTEALEVEGSTLVLGVPSVMARDRLDVRYRPLIDDALAEHAPEITDLRFVVVATDPVEADLLDLPHPSRLDDQNADPFDELPLLDELPVPPEGLDGELTVSAGPADVRPEQTFETFVIGSSNQFANAAALRVAETPARSYNPLTIYGPSGLGKTHLLHAIGNYIKQNYPTFVVRYVRTELFLYQYVDAIRNNTTTEFKRRYREIDVLLVDDIHFLEGKEGLQEEFFHTFNALHEANRQIVLTSDRPPDAIGTLQDRLRSRFVMGLVTDIQPPDLETRLAILRMKAQRTEVDIPEPTLEFIATNVKTNIRELEGALHRLTAYCRLNDLVCTMSLAQDVLAPILGDTGPKPITIDHILATTSAKFGIPVDEIIGPNRRRQLVTARQVAMYAARDLTDLSYPAIAEEFGGRDHTTIIHAVRKVSDLMAERGQLYEQVTDLIDTLRQPA
ncbi:MAG TPA: chromosomal replication initiator protein DnaA [Acidimicrobiales bacterium]|nr:chromosomal replication initiator protein DnaA [Acidimicrobiales bacterium]